MEEEKNPVEEKEATKLHFVFQDKIHKWQSKNIWGIWLQQKVKGKRLLLWEARAWKKQRLERG